MSFLSSCLCFKLFIMQTDLFGPLLTYAISRLEIYLHFVAQVVVSDLVRLSLTSYHRFSYFSRFHGPAYDLLCCSRQNYKCFDVSVLKHLHMKTFQDQKFVKFLESYNKGEISQNQEMVSHHFLRCLFLLITNRMMKMQCGCLLYSLIWFLSLVNYVLFAFFPIL